MNSKSTQNPSTQSHSANHAVSYDASQSIKQLSARRPLGVIAVALFCASALSACGGKSDSSGSSSSSSSSSSSPAATSSSPQDWVDEHNRYRQKHKVGKVVWSDKIAQSALEYVKTCPNEHSDSPYGENMAYSTTKQSAQEVMRRWYSEVVKYDYNNPRFDPNTGHFTQVVWKGTTEIGCAQASNCGGKWRDIVVCQYNPPGNYYGRFADNVFAAN